MREKLKTLPLVQLREMAKAQGLKGISTLKKAEIIDRLCELEKPVEEGQKEETGGITIINNIPRPEEIDGDS